MTVGTFIKYLQETYKEDDLNRPLEKCKLVFATSSFSSLDILSVYSDDKHTIFVDLGA